VRAGRRHLASTTSGTTEALPGQRPGDPLRLLFAAPGFASTPSKSDDRCSPGAASPHVAGQHLVDAAATVCKRVRLQPELQPVAGPAGRGELWVTTRAPPPPPTFASAIR
jgi:hypothetical protein